VGSRKGEVFPWRFGGVLVSVTVRDIAAAAGVSPGTASRALRGHPQISEFCIARVRQVAEALG
jgi:hypothetical protein